MRASGASPAATCGTVHLPPHTPPPARPGHTTVASTHKLLHSTNDKRSLNYSAAAHLTSHQDVGTARKPSWRGTRSIQAVWRRSRPAQTTPRYTSRRPPTTPFRFTKCFLTIINIKPYHRTPHTAIHHITDGQLVTSSWSAVCRQHHQQDSPGVDFIPTCQQEASCPASLHSGHNMCNPVSGRHDTQNGSPPEPERISLLLYTTYCVTRGIPLVPLS